jgi:UrcA family protein
MRNTGLFLGAVLTLGLIGLPANADPIKDMSIVIIGAAPIENGNFVVKKSVVHFEDIDFSNPKDAATLLDRISKAATAICDNRKDAMTKSTISKIYEKCRRITVADAVAKLDAPEVTRAMKAAQN